MANKATEWYINTEWKCERKGLRKEVLDLKFTKLAKPHQVSKVVIKIVDEVKNLNGRASKYLVPDQVGKEQELEMGTSFTPVDCYLELLVQQMIIGEQARCFIRCRSQAEGEEITFDIALEKILETRDIHKLNVKEMYDLALRYKENGVAMFKEYPVFAHDYFVRAAKCLISYKPFDDFTVKRDGKAGKDMRALFIQIQTNLAACLLTQKRYEDVIYQTKFVETVPEPSEKSIYRRAMAFYNMKEFEAAQKTIQLVPNYQDKKEFANLYQRIAESWKMSNAHYKNVVQRMFT